MSETGGTKAGERTGSFRRSWRRFARLWGFALFIVVVAVLFRHVLLPFIFAVLIAYILAPVVNRMSRARIAGRGMPRGVAVMLCYLVVLTVLWVFFAAFLPRLSGDFARLAKEAPQLWQRVNEEWTPKVASWLETRFPSLAGAPPDEAVPEVALPFQELPPPPGTVFAVTPLATGDYAVTVPPEGIEIEQKPGGRMVLKPHRPVQRKGLEEALRERLRKGVASLEGELAEVVKVGQAVVAGLIGGLVMLVVVFMVAAFILIDLERIHRFARSLIPRRYQDDYDQIVAGIDRGLSGVIRGQLLICLVNGILTYIGLLIFDVKYSLLLAVVAAVFSLIPIFGTVLSTIPVVLIAMVSGESGLDLLRGVFILLWILAIHFVEANLLNPNIIGKSAKMHPVLVIFALIAGEHTYGLVGALLAVPVASIIQTLFVYFRSRAWRADSGSTAPPGSPPPVEKPA